MIGLRPLGRMLVFPSLLLILGGALAPHQALVAQTTPRWCKDPMTGPLCISDKRLAEDSEPIAVNNVDSVVWKALRWQANFVQQTSWGLSKSVRVGGHPFQVDISRCGAEIDGFDPASGRITLCVETILSAMRICQMQECRKPDEMIYWESGIISFIATHELAHALVDRYHLPIVANQESAADELATILLLASDQGFVAGDGYLLLYWTGVMEKNASTPSDLLDYGRRHGFSLQRAAAVECLIRGHGGKAADGLARTSPLLDAERLASCRDDYRRAVTNWKRLLGDHWTP